MQIEWCWGDEKGFGKREMELTRGQTRIGLVVVCVGLGREFEARLEMGSWFGGEKGAPRRQVVRGTG